LGILERILESGEQRVIKDCQEIITIAGSANKLLMKGFHSETALQKIHLLERQSDRKVFSIVSMISAGSVAPNAIDNFMVLVKKEDDIVDSIYNLCREMCRYRIEEDRIEKMVDMKIMDLLGLATTSIGYLKVLFREDDRKNISMYRHRIANLEEEGDIIKDWLLSYAYKKKMDFKSFNHTIELAHKADDILDSCRSTADYFTNIMFSLTT
jgi:uncharacterized protein Yka (UPF0111/DUF47 family)